ncbi:hypothetical protein CJ010_11180 [Azoarcus sp. DD4]|uniref:rhodanese-like domain-containing protein n=1 Tax=Azoarcus sp. DD4 TaxID=2027405 RepID=UPI00112EE7B6|nr:rhodanese-like domain-containing protein [Azoarcus sp. DD4]QDF97048.1 hypothetical protein CJ010_11180 [Azoarcus sp. DD4]
MNEAIEAVLGRAQGRAREGAYGYCGSLTPAEAWAVLEARSQAKLLDIRSWQEWALVGHVPGAFEIEFRRFPDWSPVPDFVDAVQARMGKGDLILLLGRSTRRAHEAGRALAAAGFRHVYIVLEGFEGEKDAHGRRIVNGWRQAGLPWYQGEGLLGS